MTETLYYFLALEAEGLANGQIWRLWSGHLAHVGPGHLLGNLLALALLMWLSRASWSRTEASAVLVLAPPTLSLTILALRPDLAWYAGLSAMTHLLLARYCLMLPGGWRWLALGLLATKLLAETMQTTFLGPVEIVAEAHWAGVALGLLFGSVSGNPWTVMSYRQSRTPGVRFKRLARLAKRRSSKEAIEEQSA